MHKICIVTATRAEYHLLYPLIKAIEGDRELELMLIVTGTHVEEKFGNTYKDIEADGIHIDYMFHILSEDSISGVNTAMSNMILSLDEIFNKDRPDFMIILGDRYEMLSAAIVAMNYRIPIGHLYGGEATEGAIDDAIRNSITKLSYLHFTSCEQYRNRVIQMGEHPDRVFNVGAIGIENIKNVKRMSLDEFENSLNFSLGENFGVFTYHPVTLDEDSVGEFAKVLSALDYFPELKIVFTKANADVGGSIINSMIEEYADRHKDRCVCVASLGMRRYLSALSLGKIVIGNSSSGILETPSFKIPTVNIGDRQKGRIQGENVINCECETDEIVKAISLGLSEEFKLSIKDMVSPYGDGNVTEKILGQIKVEMANGISLMKKFYDAELIF